MVQSVKFVAFEAKEKKADKKKIFSVIFFKKFGGEKKKVII